MDAQLLVPGPTIRPVWKPQPLQQRQPQPQRQQRLQQQREVGPLLQMQEVGATSITYRSLISLSRKQT